MTRNNPVPIRFTNDDLKALGRLKKRTGLTTPDVLRLALRALERQETMHLDHDLQYLNEKLGKAIETVMFTENPVFLGNALWELETTLGNREYRGLKDDLARHWLEDIRQLTQPSPDDDKLAAERSLEFGSYNARAQRLTADERLQLKRAMCELRGYLTRVFWFGE